MSLYLTNKLIRLWLILQREVLRSPAFSRRTYAVLARVSPGCPPLMGRFQSITHPSAARHQGCPRAAARLACVRHAASVQSEPGSNSSVKCSESKIPSPVNLLTKTFVFTFRFGYLVLDIWRQGARRESPHKLPANLLKSVLVVAFASGPTETDKYT